MGDMSGSKSSESSSNTTTTNTTTTTNIDRRQVMAEGALGVTSDYSTINVEQMDAGVVKAALDVVAGADATAGQGFTQLLTLANQLFTAGGTILDKTANTTMDQVKALSEAQKNVGGTIDQKTILILGGLGVGAAYLMKKKG